MNTANLQLEGLIVVLTALMDALRRKGVLSNEEIAAVLDTAERAAPSRANGSVLSPANCEAVQFPIRFLRAAMDSTDGDFDFASLTSRIHAAGRTRS
ncbi:hypothetical protein MWN34_09675 [Ancylobacter sp. 6x-1]|uniref:Uncharacterized protein n=1 Tax=Ancylobacter crimeensis TaxID=2579147 RepID=A0ABT0DB47_9HYPH|nr:hypothetical protein [Ancylobacter crimeensis]MCK0197181.1 hypothetical protein [Ancylobacter crimeensis]